MLPFVEIPVLLFLIALQFSALRRSSRFWVVIRNVLTASALVAIPLLLYLGINYRGTSPRNFDNRRDNGGCGTLV
jgi:hypothetical protein